MVLVCGVEEAGRGPLIGPMVMAGILIDEADVGRLKNIGVKDSKLLSPKRRAELFDKIKNIVRKHKLIVVYPGEIDAALEADDLNLNWLEALKSAEIINELRPDKVIIDSPSNNCVAYRRYLMKLLEYVPAEVLVEHKADVNHVECGAASILAKVTRDKEVENIRRVVGVDFGSGYMADPKTKRFVEENFDRFPDILRKTWSPYKRLKSGKKQKKLEF